MFRWALRGLWLVEKSDPIQADLIDYAYKLGIRNSGGEYIPITC